MSKQGRSHQLQCLPELRIETHLRQSHLDLLVGFLLRLQGSRPRLSG